MISVMLLVFMKYDIYQNTLNVDRDERVTERDGNV